MNKGLLGSRRRLLKGGLLAGGLAVGTGSLTNQVNVAAGGAPPGVLSVPNSPSPALPPKSAPMPPPAASKPESSSSGPFKLPPLPYAPDALEPNIDQQTLKLHHDVLHQAYVDKLNAALAKYPQMANVKIEQLITNLNSLPGDLRASVRSDGGEHLNHSIFWTILDPKGGGQPEGELATAIKSAFGNFDTFQKAFTQAATDRFASGWVWLYLNQQGRLAIGGFPNGDNPLMNRGSALLGIDVWEHAYFLKHQNKRADYLIAWWKVVNWKEVNARYMASIARPQNPQRTVIRMPGIPIIDLPGIEIVLIP